ncbi:MAG TPA: hypothetical protein QGI39_08630 [Gammaproteobacteria bacterium]|nr:hypothetical protein [Gammaproteobacteria bacterium]|tara:strand:- start:6008 stop:6766 length:759 start_codon:yes stop_codon:yes gene_type:complete
MSYRLSRNRRLLQTVCRVSLLFGLLFVSVNARAYRPFDSTDADVADAAELEIELGYFGWERAEGDSVYFTPQLVLNYGLTSAFEVIAEFDVEHDPGGKSQLIDPGIFLKTVIKQGVLQERPGVSFALEVGALLPSAISEEDRTGFEAIGIVSGMLSSYTWHLNFGGGVDRIDHNSFSLWGVIIERPVSPSLRFVAELNGEKLNNEAVENSALIGFIWEPESVPDMVFDVGIRHGVSDEAADWGATLGLTFSF